MFDGFSDLDETMCSYELNNFATFVYYLKRLVSLAMTMYKWKNLPKTINKRALEKFLLSFGNACFARDDVTGDLIALPCVINGAYDIYGEPIERQMYAMNGYNLRVDDTNSVICYDNYNKESIMPALMMFAKRMEIIERTMDINIQGQRTPYIMRGSKTQINTLKEIYKQMEVNAPVIFTDKTLDLASIEVTPTVTPFISAELQDIKRNIWNEAMTFLGIHNANTEKKERLSDEEALGNQGMIANQANARLKPRQEAAELINEMFGTKIEVVINTNIDREAVIDKLVDESKKAEFDAMVANFLGEEEVDNDNQIS